MARRLAFTECVYHSPLGFLHYQCRAHETRRPLQNRGVHGNDFLGFRWSEGHLWDKKYSPVAPRTRFLLFLRFRLIDPPSVRRPKLPSRRMPKRISVSSAWRITVDEDLPHRRLNVPQLTTRISHQTVRFSPLSGGGVARCASGHDRARDSQNTSAHTSAALCMPHSMCDMPQHRPGLLAQCVMHRDESCDDEAHYIEAHDARNEAHELKSRLSPQGIDQEVLDFARQMFVGGPGWPLLSEWA